MEKVWPAAESCRTTAGSSDDGPQGVFADVGQGCALEPRPHPFDGIEVGCVGGQPLHADPAVVELDPLLDVLGTVGLNRVPEQNDTTANVAAEVAKETQHSPSTHGSRLEEQQRTGLAAITSIGQRSDRGHPLPAAGARPQKRSLPAGRPRPADHRALGEARFVHEDQGAVGSGVFFTRGQTRFFQRSIASSSRSLACLAGRCSDQPSPLRTRHTCPGWYLTPVTREITSATRGSVHRSVL